MSDDAEHVQAYRKALFGRASELATGLDGADVVAALLEASEVLRQTGIDEIYDPIPHPSDGALYSAFDITWLTLLIADLHRKMRARGAADTI